MTDILSRISSYNFFNYLFPGIVFVALSKEITGSGKSYEVKVENENSQLNPRREMLPARPEAEKMTEMKKKRYNLPTGKEQRKHPRCQPNQPLRAIFKTKDSSVEGEVISISQGGLFLASERMSVSAPRGELTLFLPDGSLKVEGIVRWPKLGQGCGMEFIDLKPQDQKRVEAYCRLLEEEGSPA